MSTGGQMVSQMQTSTLKMTPSAHALACPDILTMIFTHLSPGIGRLNDSEEVSRSRHTCRRALAAAAVTCRILSQHALDALWRELPVGTLLPLLQIIPEYKCVDSQYMLCGAILPEHWARLQLYAERIRIAAVDGQTMGEIHPSVWPFLAASARGAPLMSRLREFSAYSFDISGISALPLLLSPTLRTLEIYISLNFQSEKIPRSSHACVSLLQTLPLIVPDLERLNWVTTLHLPGGAYLQSFVHFKKLKYLFVPDSLALNEANLRMLSSIASLQSLSCSIDLSGVSALALDPHAFRGLDTLSLSGHSDHLVSFVLSCELPYLEQVNFRMVQPPITGKPRHLWTALGQRSNPTLLTSIEAHYNCAVTVRPGSLMEYFEPLLAFPNITVFDLTFFSTEPSIHDGDLAQFGAAWPQLTTFRIDHSKRYSQPNVVCPTLSGIVVLARRCPALTTLYIPEIDSNPMPEKSTVPALGHRLRSMWIDNVAPPLKIQMFVDVAAVIDRIFPWIDLEDPQNVSRSVPGKPWVQVLRFIKIMRIGRENGAAYTGLERCGS